MKTLTTFPLKSSLIPISFAKLPGWKEEDFSDFQKIFHACCQKILELPNNHIMINFDVFQWPAKLWKKPYESFCDLNNPSPAQISHFLETHFTPFHIQIGDTSKGLFTGYFQPSLSGSLTPTTQYAFPIYRKPQELLVVEDLGIFRPQFKGERIAGYVKNNELHPYFTREEIEKGALKNKGLEIAWVNDPINLFFMHIQGSGHITLEDGNCLYLSYDGTNGYDFYAIGKTLIESGEISKEAVSMQTIKNWLKTHPQESQPLMNKNISYVFFKKRATINPISRLGTPLTPQRSLAVDRKYLELGNLIWLNTPYPLKEKMNFQRLMITQDVGGAIKGPIRGDIYWGSGKKAEVLAGHTKDYGEAYILLPKNNG